MASVGGEGGWRRGELTKPSGVVSVEARPPGVSLESTISHEGPSWGRVSTAVSGGMQQATYDLVKALCGSKTSRASTNDEDVDVAGCGQLNEGGMVRGR